tara:strand:+ start:241 stop:765 length:525 start_codon:yes stop_codon:yes gene_type:complete
MKNIASSAYNSAATYGRVKAYGGAVIGSIMAFIFIIIGLYSFFKKNPYSKTTRAKVTRANCSPVKSSNNNTMYHCNLNLEYSINNQKMSKVVHIDTSYKYYDDDKITVGYDPEDIDDVSLNYNSNSVIGIVFIFISIIILASVWMNVYIVRHSKLAASAEAASNLTKTLFKKRN